MNHNNISVLIMCTYESTYVIQLMENIKKYYGDIIFSLFTHESVLDFYEKRLDEEVCKKIYYFGKHEYLLFPAVAKLPRFDIIHTLWMERFWGECAGLLKRKCNAWFNSIGGSDLYRLSSNKFIYFLQNRIIRKSDWISSENEETRSHFNKVYKIQNGKYKSIPHDIIPFGIDILDSIDELCTNDVSKINEIKHKYALPLDKIIIMCGTNARKQQQHEKLLDAIGNLPEIIKQRICLLIPMTYSGTQEYIDYIKVKADSIIQSIVLSDYLSTDEMAELALVTDILIHVQTTDQLSSIMLSHMYVGNIVIAGSWLPYDDLRKKGIKFVSIDEIDELTDVIPSLIDKTNTIKPKNVVNRQIIHEMSSWENSAKKWYNVYESLYKQNNG